MRTCYCLNHVTASLRLRYHYGRTTFSETFRTGLAVVRDNGLELPSMYIAILFTRGLSSTTATARGGQRKRYISHKTHGLLETDHLQCGPLDRESRTTFSRRVAYTTEEIDERSPYLPLLATLVIKFQPLLKLLKSTCNLFPRNGRTKQNKTNKQNNDKDK